MNKKSIITVLLAFVALAANAAVLAPLRWQATIGRAPDSLKKDLEDYDYLVSFVEKNYAPFDAIMQKSYKREYKTLKKQIREQLYKGNSDLEKASSDYVMWFYSQFDRHIGLETVAFQMASSNFMNAAILKMDSTVVTGTFEYDPKPVSCKVDSYTWLIRVPSCSTDNHEWTIKALQQFDESDCENLIIDVRGNGGGSDGVWPRFYDLLYDHPNKPFICWFRNTPENVNQWKSFWQSNDKYARSFIEECEYSKKKFLKWVETSGDTGRKPTTRIRRAAILVDMMTASAAESIAEFAKKHSNRTKVYGIGNTLGCELTGNCREGVLPNSKIKLSYATTVDSDFYEKDFSEGLGVTPDVIIPLPMARKFTDNIDEWVLWVAEDLKR